VKHKLYLAAPLFNYKERLFNEEIDQILSQFFSVFLPQRDGVLIPGREVSKEVFNSLSKEAYFSDINAIKDADVVFALLDGRSIDEGVAFEIGYATALGKKCVGLKTDSRVLLPHGNNPMIACSLFECFDSLDRVYEWAKKEVS
jgi:nucleoside 2-deoxyribosyltransferase